MLINTKYRSIEAELMDDLTMEGEMLRKTLDQIALINRWLGGDNTTINGLNSLLHVEHKDSIISIIDIGCGAGDILRKVADYGRKNNFKFKLTGIDANEYTVNYARKLSANYPEISYITINVLATEFFELAYDIVLATLFLHHFKNEEIENLLNRLIKKAQLGIIINDLHRSRTAYYLFKLISIFIANPMVKKDGAISVLRGFKKKELIEISNEIQGTVSSICWKWAFRYQWIIKKS